MDLASLYSCSIISLVQYPPLENGQQRLRTSQILVYNNRNPSYFVVQLAGKLCFDVTIDAFILWVPRSVAVALKEYILVKAKGCIR